MCERLNKTKELVYATSLILCWQDFAKKQAGKTVKLQMNSGNRRQLQLFKDLLNGSTLLVSSVYPQCLTSVQSPGETFLQFYKISISATFWNK